MSRTPPGVRELKLRPRLPRHRLQRRRTPPGVRELKLLAYEDQVCRGEVAPLPGCVN